MDGAADWNMAAQEGPPSLVGHQGQRRRRRGTMMRQHLIGLTAAVAGRAGFKGAARGGRSKAVRSVSSSKVLLALLRIWLNLGSELSAKSCRSSGEGVRPSVIFTWRHSR